MSDAEPSNKHLPSFPAQSWIKMKFTEIPSKRSLHPSFQKCISEVARQKGGGKVLDIGCGDGRIALRIEEQAASNSGENNLQIIGVDCNVGAIQAANESASKSKVPGGSRARFIVGDATSVDLNDSEEPFDLVLCQLVISIVGGVAQRKALLAVCLRHVKPNGKVLISASGASEDVNPQYRQIYYQDLAVTEEYRTYVSRGPNGEFLYLTHHFTADELIALLRDAGFVQVELIVEAESSSRRPDQEANFYYVTATSPETNWDRSESVL